MFESLVSRLTSPPVSRRRHTVHAAREVCSEPEEETPAPRRSRAKHLLDKRRKARLSCADLTAATNAEPERSSRMDALKAFLPLRQSKSLGRLDGLKEKLSAHKTRQICKLATLKNAKSCDGLHAAPMRVRRPRTPVAAPCPVSPPLSLRPGCTITITQHYDLTIL
ncbi:Uncharacterized protein OBRU01_23021 [Operophtera brumata]|uniref:Uncharacterized protein n=1 Tax=Operophtera brumata TaxID=104452 RepID=A0A0L7KPJ9_OPEBR|nr:Uncharacterized protein OBRU01_23021 [Operophtera brumata]